MSFAGLRLAPAAAQRVAVMTVIVSLHGLLIHLLDSGDPTGSSPEYPPSYAEFLPVDDRVVQPPAFPEIAFQTRARLKVQFPQVVIDDEVQASPLPPPPGQLIQPELPSSAEVAAPPADPFPVLSPRPLSGPSGMERYLKAALKAKESGTVVMNICVTTQGGVASVGLARSSGFPKLDEVALGIAAEYRFDPAKRLGRPVAACELFRIVFKVN